MTPRSSYMAGASQLHGKGPCEDVARNRTGPRDTRPRPGCESQHEQTRFLRSSDRIFSPTSYRRHTGVAPKIQESDKWVGKTRISKTGDPAVRKALYIPALTAWQHNPVIRTFCQRLKANGKNGKAIACAAMRKLIHIAFAILQSGKPFNSNFAHA